MAISTAPEDLGWKAPDFVLPGIDGKEHALADLRGGRGTVVAFICNHCPYVKAITGRLVEDVEELNGQGVAFIAINSNDAENYPEDSFDKMKAFAAARGFNFHYLHDESQQVARAYGAVCTPDFFGFDKDLNLRYRGRLDMGRTDAPPDGAPRELVNAMGKIAESGTGPKEQFPSMGCSIKWKA